MSSIKRRILGSVYPGLHETAFKNRLYRVRKTSNRALQRRRRSFPLLIKRAKPEAGGPAIPTLPIGNGKRDRHRRGATPPHPLLATGRQRGRQLPSRQRATPQWRWQIGRHGQNPRPRAESRWRSVRPARGGQRPRYRPRCGGDAGCESRSKVAALQAVARAAECARDEAAQRLAAILRELRPRDRPAFAERPYPSF